MITDRVGDFIVRLTNAGAIKKPTVSVRHSAHLEAIAEKLKALGFIADCEVTRKEPKTLVVTLAYDDFGAHKIRGVKRISKPGRRLYAGSREAHSVKQGHGARVLSTPKGILSDAEARKVHAGGETLFEIW